jgi:hypothetical protein
VTTSESGNGTKAENLLCREAGKTVGSESAITSTTTAKTAIAVNADDEDDRTQAPEDNDYDDNNDNDADDEIIELDEDEEPSLRTFSDDDLVQAVTQTLTLTLNNQSNSLLVSMPSSPGGSCSNLIKNPAMNKSSTIKRRPETGPGIETANVNNQKNLQLFANSSNEDCDEGHEYQNVFMRKGRIISRPINHNDDTDEEEDLDNFVSETGTSSMMSINRVILSESGVTTIEEGRHSGDHQFDDDAVPVVHAVINLPPRMMNLIKQRRRRTTGDVMYEKSSRLSRLMMADFKAGEKHKPANLKLRNESRSSSGSSSGGGCGTPVLVGGIGIIGGAGDTSSVPEACKSFANKAKSRLSSTGSKVTSNVEKVGKSVSTMRRKVGSWYQKRVKTPVKQFSNELGLEGPLLRVQSGDLLANSQSEERINQFRPKSTSDVPTDLDFDEGDYSVVSGEYTFSSEILQQQQPPSKQTQEEDPCNTESMRKVRQCAFKLLSEIMEMRIESKLM